MVGMGSGSSSTPSSGEKTSVKEIVTVFGGLTVGVGVLLLGVVGIIVALPTPDTSSTMIANEMLTSEQSARAARQRLQRSKLEKSTWEIERLRRNSIEMLSSDEAAQEARDRIASYSAEAEFVGFRDERCEDERSFLLELLTDRQLNEFIEYINEEYGEDDDGEYTYSAETLKKDSCCCGATIMSPCACMFEGVMDCSAVEPKCPCYEWPSNVNSPIELDNWESKCPRCKTDLTEEWWDEVHDEELGDWEVEEGGRAKYYRTWYGNCPSCRSYFELSDDDYDHGESMVGWEPSYIDRAESFAAENRVSEVTVYVEVPDKANTESVSFQLPQHIIENEDVIHEAIENRLMDILQQPFGGWDLISVKKLEAESVVKEYNPEKLIPIGSKVRSYDFWPHDKTCYKEGVIIDHAPSPSCSPGCLHYHIRTTKVVRRGKSRAVDEGEIFMTHPYADIFDEDYSAGQLAPHIQIISTAFPSTSDQ